MARLGLLSVKGRVVGVGVRVLQLRMYGSKDVEMKGLLQTLLLQRLLSRPLNAFALGSGLRRSPWFHPCASFHQSHAALFCVHRQNVIRPMGVRPDGTLLPLEETLRVPEEHSGSDSD